MTTTKLLVFGLLGVAMLASCDDDDSNGLKPQVPVSVSLSNDLDISENHGPKEIILSFSKNAESDGMIVLQVETDYPDDFTTTPQMEDGEIVLEVEKGDSQASFTVTPLNNTSLNDTKEILFTIKGVSEGMQTGQKSTLTLSVSDDETAVFANFAVGKDSMMENAASAREIKILLSGPAPAAGKIIIERTTDKDFFTSPPVNAGNKMEIIISEGASEGSFIILPGNDELLKGTITSNFKIVETQGGIVKGTTTSLDFNIKDDELVGKAKFYETFGGGWRVKNSYEYDEQGRIYKIHWEQATPGLTSGTRTIYYAPNGLVERMNEWNGQDVYYYQENNRIVRSEVIQNGIKKSYTLYDYDDAGNVGGLSEYYLQESGEYVNTSIIIYLYFFTGNLYKQLMYSPQPDGEEPALVSVRTYDAYIGLDNPFHFFEVIPNHNAQPNWPGSLRQEEGGTVSFYTFNYEFDSMGQIIKRTVNSAPDVTYYGYY